MGSIFYTVYVGILKRTCIYSLLLELLTLVHNLYILPSWYLTVFCSQSEGMRKKGINYITTSVIKQGPTLMSLQHQYEKCHQNRSLFALMIEVWKLHVTPFII